MSVDCSWRRATQVPAVLGVKESLSAAVWISRGKDAPAPMTYRGLLDPSWRFHARLWPTQTTSYTVGMLHSRFLSLLRQARALVQSHLDHLLRACLVAGVDLQVVAVMVFIKSLAILMASYGWFC